MSGSSAAVDVGNSELEKQNNLRNNVTLSNVPFVENENLFDIVRGVCIPVEVIDAINELKREDIVAYRVKNSRSNSIIVKFANFEMKAELMRNKTNSR